MAEEKLIIDIQTRDGLTPALDKAGSEVKSFASEAEASFKKIGQSFDATTASTSKMSSEMSNVGDNIDKTKGKALTFASAASDKFRELAKAAVGIFTADIVAKALGFSSAMDAVNRASQAVAENLGAAIKNLVGLGPAYEQAQRAAVRFEEAVANARSNREKGALSTSQEFSIDARRRTSFDLAPFISLPASQFDAAAVALDEQRQRLSSIDDQFRDELNKGGQFRVPDQALLERLSSEFADVQRNIQNEVERAIARQIAADGQRIQAALGSGAFGPEGFPAVPDNFQFIAGGGGAGGARGGGRSSGGFSFNDTRARRFALIQAEQQRQQLLAAQASFPSLQGFDGGEFADEARGDRGSSALLGKLLGLGASGVEKIAGGVAQLGSEIGKLGKFGVQAESSFYALGRSIEESLGGQVVIGSFNALSSFFERALQGQATLRDLGRSFVALGAQILSQQAAFRLLGLFFGGGAAGGGFFGSGGGAGAVSSSGGDGIASGGLPSALTIGGGGGASVGVTLNVASLDPRTAADVILQQMPAIERAISSSIISGQSRALRTAVRGA